jgi:DNA-binding NarL/FixJ family response regulator
MSPSFKIALLDDHAIVRVGYRRLLELEPGLEVIAEYGDAESASQGLRQLSDDQIDLLVLDLSLPGRSGLDFLRDMRNERPHLKVLVVSMHDSPADRKSVV